MTVVAIPTLEAIDTLLPLLASLLRDPTATTILVMDNGHVPENRARLDELAAAHPKLEIADCHGWALHRMWNWAWEWALEHGDEFVGIYNDDLVVPEILTTHLTAALRRDPTLWLVSPDWMRPLAAGQCITGVRYVKGTQRHGGIGGWCFVLRASARARGVPPIDERFQWWCGDDDLAVQIDLAGGKLGVVMGLPLDHYAETTASKHEWTHTARWEDARYYEEKYGPGTGP